MDKTDSPKNHSISNFSNSRLSTSFPGHDGALTTPEPEETIYPFHSPGLKVVSHPGGLLSTGQGLSDRREPSDTKAEDGKVGKCPSIEEPPIEYPALPEALSRASRTRRTWARELILHYDFVFCMKNNGNLTDIAHCNPDADTKPNPRMKNLGFATVCSCCYGKAKCQEWHNISGGMT
jgi:hypothetical protein